MYTGLAEEFRCFHDIPNYFLKENFEDRRRLLESLGMDSDVPHIFLVLRHTVSVEERGIRTMLKSARVKNNERSINDRVKLLDQLADRLVYGFEGFHNNSDHHVDFTREVPSNLLNDFNSGNEGQSSDVSSSPVDEFSRPEQ